MHAKYAEAFEAEARVGTMRTLLRTLLLLGNSLSLTNALVAAPPPTRAAVSPLSASSVPPPERSVVVGAGPAGLATAVMLAKRGWSNIEVFDRLPPPPAVDDDDVWSDTARFYLIGIGGRGREALQEIGAWDGPHGVEKYTAPVRGRKDWAPGAGVDGGVETIRADRPPSNVIQRDRLVSCLLAQAEELGVKVNYETDVTDIRWEGESAVLSCSPCGEACAVEEADADASRAVEVETPFVIASDGVRRTVAEAIEAEDAADAWRLPWRKFRVTKYEDKSVRVYKTVPFRPPADWRGDINYSARTAAANFDALPTQSGEYCGVLLIKPDDAITQGLPDVPAARAYFDELLPMFSPMIADEALQGILDKQPSRLPLFRFAGPRLHRGGSTTLLGDAIHSVKPYFGLGVNAAFEDVAALGAALDEQPSLERALRSYSRKRAAEARVLVALSRSFDRSGVAGLLSFILPLILDGVFHGAAPAVFAPNTLAMLQRPDLSFTHIRWRKRADRAAQLLLLGGAATAAARLVGGVVGVLARALARTAWGGAVGGALALRALPVAAAAAALALFVRQRMGSDVADVLSAQNKETPDGVKTRPGY